MGNEQKPLDKSKQPKPADMAPPQAIALQRTGSNAALSQMLQRAPRSATPAPAQARTEERISELEAQNKRLESKQRATLHLAGFQNAVMERVTGWELAILNLGRAYTKAAKNHTDAVEKKKKVDAAMSQAMLSVWSAATLGGMAWVSGTLQTAQAATSTTSLLTNVLEDVLQHSAGEVLSANMPGLAQRVPTPDQTAVSAEPLDVQDEHMARLKASELLALGKFKVFNAQLLDAPVEYWDHYDEDAQVARYNEWLAQADLLKGASALPSVEEMAEKFERGFWAKWAPSLMSTRARLVAPRYRDFPDAPSNLYTSPSTAVEQRLTALGITKDSGVQDFGWLTDNDEIQKVIDWANGYEVKRFIR